jgi:Ankyrin repeats (3 copies)
VTAELPAFSKTRFMPLFNYRLFERNCTGFNMLSKEEVNIALLEASLNGDTYAVKSLLDAGADAHVMDDFPLRLASLNGHSATVGALLRAGADVHAWDDYALRWAREKGHARTVKALLRAGADAGRVWRYAGRAGTATRTPSEALTGPHPATGAGASAGASIALGAGIAAS